MIKYNNSPVILHRFNGDEDYDCMERIYDLNPIYSNYLNQAIDETDFFYASNCSFILVKEIEDKYRRIYLMSNDLEDSIRILRSLEGICILNMPTEGDITVWKKLMENSEFELLGVYERFYNTNIHSFSNSKNISYAILEQEPIIYDLFQDYFSFYMDYPPTHEELRHLITQKNVIVNYEGTSLCGAFVFELKGKKCYLRLWRDTGKDGLKLLLDFYTLAAEKGIDYIYFWVNSENLKVKKMHKLLGAQQENVKDYSFIKR